MSQGGVQKFTAASFESKQPEAAYMCMEDWLNGIYGLAKARCMLLLKKWSKFYALTWKDLQDILFMKKSCRIGERLTSFVSQVHTYTDTQTSAQTDDSVHTHSHAPIPLCTF